MTSTSHSGYIYFFSSNICIGRVLEEEYVKVNNFEWWKENRK